MGRAAYDAVVVGAGPNGLAAAVTLAQAARSVLVVEAEPTIGGGTRSAGLTLPGFRHDICSAIHPLAAASPFFRTLPLDRHGLELVQPQAPLAHPLDDGACAMLERDVGATAASLGRDAAAYERLLHPFLGHADGLVRALLAPPRPPRDPLALGRFAVLGARSATGLANAAFEDEPAKALLAGNATHALLPLERRPAAGIGLLLMLLGHSVGWPLARGGSQAIADALAGLLRELGGDVVTGRRVRSLADLPPARDVLLDLDPRQLARIAGDRLPAGYRNRLARYRHSPGVFKVDWALDGPIPWKAEGPGRAGTVHVGGTLGEIADAERQVARGGHPERPFIILAQQSLFDASRAPAGQQTGWAYCHVPNGSDVDMTERIEAQVERFAPGFRDRIIGRATMGPRELERHNANCVGGDISGGLQDLRHVFLRPTIQMRPYRTPAEGIWLCSASTPPGAGVHGMSGHFAARAVLRRRRS